MFKIYSAIGGFQNHDLVDRNEEFYDGDIINPEDLEDEKWEDYYSDIASGLSFNQ